MRFHSLTIALLAAAPLLPLGSQEITTLREGQRVRISSTSTKELVGVVRQAGADSIVVYSEPSGAPLTIASSDLRKVEVSRGRITAEGAKRGALWGGGIGAGFALLGAVLIGTSDIEYDHTDNAIGEFAANMIGGGIVWGAVIGAFVKAERWDRAAIQPRVSRSAVGFSIAFR